MKTKLSWLAAGLLALGSFPGSAPAQYTIVNVIPTAQSGEMDQNSEPSLAVCPTNTLQTVVASFSQPPTVPAPAANTLLHPIFVCADPTSADPNKKWKVLVTLNHGDQSYAWSAGGTAFGTFLGYPAAGDISFAKSSNPNGTPAQRFTTSVGGNIYNSGGTDQPWIYTTRAGNSDRIYISFNDTSRPSAANPNASASVIFSLDSGNTWTGPNPGIGANNGRYLIENVNPGRIDGAAVRVAALGDRVYVAFERFDATGGQANKDRRGHLVIVRDDNAGVGNGVNGFRQLGANGTTITATFPTPVDPIIFPWDGLTLGNERLGSDLAIAIDPRNPDAVYVAYAQDAGAAPNFNPVVHVAYSSNGGTTWNDVYQTTGNAAMPALAVATNGTVGLLYTAFNAGNNNLETHFVQASSGFSAPVINTLICTFPNNDPAQTPWSPYIGDYQGLKSVGNSFFGAFSASGQPLGTHFPKGAYFERNVIIAGAVTNNFFLSTTMAGNLAGPIPTNAAPVTNKWVQVPDTSTNGLDVRACDPIMTADDFLCTTSGPITRLAVWASWLTNNVNNAPSFLLKIWSDVPATNGMPSRPGVNLWTGGFSTGYYVTNVYANNVNETFVDPSVAGTNGILGPDNAIWQYTFNIATNGPNAAFVQTNGEIYWFSVYVAGLPANNTFGWKTCPTNWNDGAVYAPYGSTGDDSTNWTPVIRPGTSNVVDLAFAIGAGGPVMATNVAYSIDPFYFSTAAQANSNNIWSQLPGFQANPNNPQNLGADRESDINLKYLTSSNMVADDFVANGSPVLRVRWWGSYFNGLDYPVEDGYILSFFANNPTNASGYSSPTNLLATYVAPIQAVRLCNSGYVGCDNLPIYQYEVNFKDISRNYSAGANGLPTGFVGTSNSVYWLSIAAFAGATVNPANGMLVTNGNPRTASTNFWGWHTSPMQNLDLSVTGGLNASTNPLVYGPWTSNSPVCAGQDVDQAFALFNDLGAVAPPVTFNNNSFTNLNTLQSPNLTSSGMDVQATAGSSAVTVADDFLAVTNGAVVNIHTWNSWRSDQIDPGATISLSFWDNVPGTTNSASRPSHRLWFASFTNGPSGAPYSYSVSVEASGINCERFFNPQNPAAVGSDMTVYRYDFTVPVTNAFYQVSNNIYWLAQTAVTATTNLFGWKTCITNNHNLDPAVWAPVARPATNQWSSMYYPSNSLYSQFPIDLSFGLCSVYITPPPPLVTNISIVGKWFQSPDTSSNGLDVRATVPKILADDFLCTTSGPITKIEVWGSWLFNNSDTAPTFTLGIWSDVPAANPNPSYPGIQLWSGQFSPGQYYYEPYGPSQEQFYDPDLGTGADAIIGFDNQIWHYTFPVAYTNAFVQTNGTVYWLSLTVQVSTNFYMFGWKTCPTNWNDNAVFGDLDQFGNLTNGWDELVRPVTLQGLDLSFALSDTIITTNPPPAPPPPYIPTNYLVQWSQSPAYLHSSTPSGEDRASDFTWGTAGPWSVVADDFQSDGRNILGLRWWGSYLNGFSPDVVDGFVLSFYADAEPTSGDDDDGDSRDDSGSGYAGSPGALLGTYLISSAAVKMTDSGVTGADGNEIFQYQAALGDGCVYVPGPGTTAGAFQVTAGTTYWVSIQAEAGLQPYHTTDFYGAPTCGSSLTLNQPATDFWGWHTTPCQQLSPSVTGNFDNEGTDWQYYDWMENGPASGEIDQAFETLVDSTNAPPPAPVSTSLTGVTWLQRPDLTPEGLSMLATLGQNSTKVTDDFVMTNDMPLTSIKIWGAWQDDNIDPNAIFQLNIYSNAPLAGRPNSSLWQAYFTNIFSYQVFPETPTVCGEPFFDPSSNGVAGVDSQVYRYEFYEPSAQAFTPVPNTVYWLSVSAITTNRFGWKTAAPYDHFNYNAAWFNGAGWPAMAYPATHPYASRATNTLDMAFALTEGCAGLVGGAPPEPTSTLQDDGTVLISWPDTGDCFYILQQSPQLVPATWTPVQLTTPTSLVVQPTNSMMFYRLSKP